jgi:3-dehydroquinate synthase
MKEIKITLKNSQYPVLIGDSVFNNIVPVLKKLNLCRNIFFIIDGNVENYYGEKIREAFAGWDFRKHFFSLEPGEQSKSFSSLTRIYDSLLNNKFNRESLIIGIGGGVTGDITGFAASTFMRGIRVVHLPTTIIAAVDSSIGGKTGINFHNKKNMIGTFYQPELVMIDTSFFKTLPPEEITSGLGEIVKYGYLADKNFFRYVVTHIEQVYRLEKKVIDHIINTSAALKGSVVAKDEKEMGLRKILNLGHTFAHAFESIMDFRIMHGEAVGAGIISALFLSRSMGILSGEKLQQLLQLPLKMKLTASIDLSDKDKILEIMKSDKKSSDGRINFVLIKDIGNILLNVSCEKEKVFHALEKTEKILKERVFTGV